MMTPVAVAIVVCVGESDGSRAAPSPPNAFASPKSSTLTVPSSRTLMFAGFKSRWMTPLSCAASRASAGFKQLRRPGEPCYVCAETGGVQCVTASSTRDCGRLTADIPQTHTGLIKERCR